MNADDNTQIEYIVIIDNDDEESVKALEEAKIIFRALHNVNLEVITIDRLGYGKLHHYHNIAAKKFTGDCLLERNDDHFCITKGWDTIVCNSIEPYKNEPIVIHQKGLNETVWWATAPGINRKWYDVSTNNGKLDAFAEVGIDVWLMRYAEDCGLKVIPAGYQMISMQRGEEHSGKVGGIQNQLPEDEVLEERRNSANNRSSDPELRKQHNINLKNWKD
tara:strand:- start:879 stop:1535 length:657 start_codon:yes stop_codon:yes gene_type:complete